MKRTLFTLLLVCALLSCKNNNKKTEIIYYGTDEFKEFEKNAEISKEKAWQLQTEYLTKNNQDKMVVFCIL